MAAIADILEEIVSYGDMDPDYVQKQIHRLPQAPVVDRPTFLLACARGLRILNLGSASGPLHAALKQVAASVIGVDRTEGPDTDWVVDLDENPFRLRALMQEPCDLILAGEILEHLGNPGRCLEAIRELSRPLLLTVPNAMCGINRYWVEQGYENCNRDHVAWYSPRTLLTLLTRYGFEVSRWAWYNGMPGTAEGLIVLTR
jgi:2-polyprenyl-3-methyl-5-hydroxy-6-metoxy-1,4-benzoquinol methylase